MSKSLVKDGDANMRREKIVAKIPFSYPTKVTISIDDNYEIILKFEDVWLYETTNNPCGEIKYRPTE